MMSLSKPSHSLRALLPLAAVLFSGIASGNTLPTDGNIIPNGDFSKGNTGFVCQLPYVKPAIDCLWPCTYTVARAFNEPQLHHLIAPESFSAPKPKTRKEQVLFMNAGGQDPVTVWQTEVKCQPNTKYLISFCSISLSGYILEGNPPHQMATMEWMPDFEIWAGDEPSQPIQAGKGEYSRGSMVWESKKKTSAVIKIVRTRMEHTGGLIGISNIEMIPLREVKAAADN